MYNSARNALGQERAKKMFAVCSAKKTAALSSEREFAVTLGIIEGDLDSERQHNVHVLVVVNSFSINYATCMQM
jgi:hypothetical protein